MKVWTEKALNFLNKSLDIIPQELNELDWKETLSPNSDKLCKQICSFANLPGVGFLAFGINDTKAKPFTNKITNAARNN